MQVLASLVCNIPDKNVSIVEAGLGWKRFQPAEFQWNSLRMGYQLSFLRIKQKLLKSSMNNNKFSCFYTLFIHNFSLAIRQLSNQHGKRHTVPATKA